VAEPVAIKLEGAISPRPRKKAKSQKKDDSITTDDNTIKPIQTDSLLGLNSPAEEEHVGEKIEDEDEEDEEEEAQEQTAAHGVSLPPEIWVMIAQFVSTAFFASDQVNIDPG